MEVQTIPQLQLPMFPNGVTDINVNLAFKKEDDRITYFSGKSSQAF
jgi:hypothetical protein